MSFINLDFVQTQKKQVDFLIKNKKTKKVLNIGIEKGFFCQEVRLKVYEFIFGKQESSDKKKLNSSLDITQDNSFNIQNDIDRSYRSITDKEEVQKKKENLQNFLYKFLQNNPSCKYVQGLHEAAQFYIENFGENLSQYYFDQIILLLIQDLMDEKKIHHLIKNTLENIIEFLSKDFANKIQIQHIGRFLSLYFSLFTNLNNQQTILRVWDYLICIKKQHGIEQTENIISVLISNIIKFILRARGFDTNFNDEKILQVLNQFDLSSL